MPLVNPGIHGEKQPPAALGLVRGGSSATTLGVVRRALFVALSVLALAGCERGCLARRLASRSSDAPDAGPAFDLGGTDCSDGLARCTEGRIEVSRAAHLPHPCAPFGASPEDRRRLCECPWEVVGRCAAGCAADGVEIVATPDVAAAQLCAALAPVARPPTAADPPVTGVCASEEVRCESGVVRVCDAPGRPVRTVAVCLDGCEPAVGWPEGVPGERATGAGAGAILCRRDHAERR